MPARHENPKIVSFIHDDLGRSLFSDPEAGRESASSDEGVPGLWAETRSSALEASGAAHPAIS